MSQTVEGFSLFSACQFVNLHFNLWNDQNSCACTFMSQNFKYKTNKQNNLLITNCYYSIVKLYTAV